MTDKMSVPRIVTPVSECLTALALREYVRQVKQQLSGGTSPAMVEGQEDDMTKYVETERTCTDCGEVRTLSAAGLCHECEQALRERDEQAEEDR